MSNNLRPDTFYWTLPRLARTMGVAVSPSPETLAYSLAVAYELATTPHPKGGMYWYMDIRI